MMVAFVIWAAAAALGTVLAKWDIKRINGVDEDADQN